MDDTKPDPKKDPAPAPATSAGVTDAAKQPDISGGIVEQSILTGVPMDHPAIDSNPREGLPPESSRIDMNDPSFDAPTLVVATEPVTKLPA
jgi:hypothetical protein